MDEAAWGNVSADKDGAVTNVVDPIAETDVATEAKVGELATKAKIVDQAHLVGACFHHVMGVFGSIAYVLIVDRQVAIGGGSFLAVTFDSDLHNKGEGLRVRGEETQSHNLTN